MKKALVVLSGGQDSTLCLFWAVQEFGKKNVSAITFNYGQRHARELDAAARVASLAGVGQTQVNLGPILLGKSPLTDPNQELEQYTDFKSMDETIGNRIERTFVPLRNALFLTIAANHAYVMGCDMLVTGVCQADNANYPDCTMDFVMAQTIAINKALGLPHIEEVFSTVRGSDLAVTRQPLSVATPLMNMSKKDSVQWSVEIPGAYSALAYSHTAYDGQFPPVGHDHATVLRAHGFEEADIPDPLVIRAHDLGVMELPKTDNYKPHLLDIARNQFYRELGYGIFTS